MNNNLLFIIKTLTAGQGEGILADAKRVRAHLSDFAADEPKAQKNALVKCLEYGFYGELKNTPAEGRVSVKSRFAQKLHNDEGLVLTLCADALDLLEAAVFGVVSEGAKTAPAPSTDGDAWETVAEQKAASQVDATVPLPGTFKIGDRGPGGGIVFFAQGNKYMEVSELLGKYNWKKAMTVAGKYKGGKYSDWRLPTKEELNLIYQNLRENNLGNMDDKFYWSSSEDDSNGAWGQRFSDGYQHGSNKYYTASVRAVRVF